MIAVGMDVAADPHSATLTLRGDFDREQVGAFREALASVACRSASTVVIDLTDLSHMDDHGLNELVRARDRLHRIVLRGPRPQFLEQLRAAHLAGVFDFADGAGAPALLA
jgi:anti-anti-sigma factor